MLMIMMMMIVAGGFVSISNFFLFFDGNANHLYSLYCRKSWIHFSFQSSCCWFCHSRSFLFFSSQYIAPSGSVVSVHWLLLLLLHFLIVFLFLLLLFLPLLLTVLRRIVSLLVTMVCGGDNFVYWLVGSDVTAAREKERWWTVYVC